MRNSVLRFRYPALITRGIFIFYFIAMTALGAGRGYAPWVGESFEGIVCKGGGAVGGESGFGPYDYILDKDKLNVVEKAHFTTDVELLTGGKAGRYPSGGINYTLGKFPNHHRALNSAIQLHFQLEARAGNVAPLEDLRSPIECYFQRAINYSPKDATSHMLYAMLLHRSGKHEMSREQYKVSRGLQTKSENLEYNYALLLVDIGEYPEARKIAQDLYDSGFPLPGLKNKLNSVGQWN